MSTKRKALVHEKLASVKVFVSQGRRAEAWAELEEAHIVAQPLAYLHTLVHLKMLVMALRDRSIGELFGQAIRLLIAAPGSLTGRYPPGNNGRSHVSMFKTMPLSSKLLARLTDLDSDRI